MKHLLITDDLSQATAPYVVITSEGLVYKNIEDIPLPNNEIWYTANEKLIETISSSVSGLHTKAFNTTIKSHTFEDRKGVITFDNDVTSIASNAFYGCSELTSINIPDGVTTIGLRTFQYCSKLTSITIPDSVTSIGQYTFEGCSSLIEPVYNSNVFFYLPTSYQGSYTIPDGVKSIGHNALRSCSELTSITIPDSVTKIGNFAFYYCSKLTSVIYKGITYTSISAIESALKTNGVSVGTDVFKITKLS